MGTRFVFQCPVYPCVPLPNRASDETIVEERNNLYAYHLGNVEDVLPMLW